MENRPFPISRTVFGLFMAAIGAFLRVFNLLPWVLKAILFGIAFFWLIKN